ncbi:MAG: nitroreductase [Thermoanaerobacter thermocopriae]|nr:MAG: nitroreductase [Thermoanaerobacter thermocopriae]
MKECQKLITERRSITFFDTTKEISDDLIKKVLEVAATAPMDGFSEEKMKEFLGIDVEKMVPMIVAIGYKAPEKNLLPRAYRFKFDEFGEII